MKLTLWELGINKYLVDFTETRNTDTVLDSYEFAYKDMVGIEGLARVATLVSPGDNSHNFIETVAINAGLKMNNPAASRRSIKRA